MQRKLFFFIILNQLILHIAAAILFDSMRIAGDFVFCCFFMCRITELAGYEKSVTQGHLNFAASF